MQISAVADTAIMEDATFRLNMVYTLAAGTAQRPFAAAPVAVCNRRMHL